MSYSPLIIKAFQAFANDAGEPVISIRGGNALDDYQAPPPYDPLLDEISDSYFETYHWGITYLDPNSWRHYLPYLIEYSIRHIQQNTLVVDQFLTSLRPPDHNPPRLASLNAEQEAVVAEFLDVMSFNEQSVHQELACQVLEEWWIPDALYRNA